MGKIIELSQHVSNQIAAGEVVERPCSVVKELIENSLDADALNIEIRVKDGGLAHLVVQDDGIGMDEADVRLAIKRYATSKLATVSDLDSIATFGFRGEALPSIASVSQMSIISRPFEQAHGTKAVIDGGAVRELTKAGANFGTRIEVRDLFFNVPARLKFVKSKRAENAEIDRLLRAYAFVYPSIGWKFFVDDKLVFSSRASDDRDFERALLLLGRDTEGLLYRFDQKTEVLRISGAVAAPMASRRDGRGINLFVNHRLVSDKKLVIAVKTSFRTILEVGRNPICALKIDIAPSEVDVNVHPRKAEVRFKDERRVMSHFISLLSGFLSKTPWLKHQIETTTWSSAQASSTLQEQSKRAMSTFDFLLGTGEEAGTMPVACGFTAIDNSPKLPFNKASTHPHKKLLAAANFSDLRVIGQVSSTYLLTESDEGLVVIDQHAAHERVMFEKIRAAVSQNTSSSPLLIPITIHLDFSEMNLFEEHLLDLRAIGIEAEIFGEHSVIIRALPDFIGKADIRALMLDILSDLSNHGRASTTEQIYDHVAATLACHSSLRAGQRMNKEEIEALLIELDGTAFGAHCPHGRPLVKSHSASEMKKWFDRT